MAKIVVSAEGPVDAPADTVYGYIADMREHPRFLPPAFPDFRVESGGVGADTITRFKMTAGGRTREYRRALRAIYADELKRLDAYAREHRSA